MGGPITSFGCVGALLLCGNIIMIMAASKMGLEAAAIILIAGGAVQLLGFLAWAVHALRSQNSESSSADWTHNALGYEVTDPSIFFSTIARSEEREREKEAERKYEQWWPI